MYEDQEPWKAQNKTLKFSRMFSLNQNELKSYLIFFDALTLWKFVAENHTEKFAALKITLKNNVKESFTENYTEKRPLLFRNAKNG